MEGMFPGFTLEGFSSNLSILFFRVLSIESGLLYSVFDLLLKNCNSCTESSLNAPSSLAFIFKVVGGVFELNAMSNCNFFSSVHLADRIDDRSMLLSLLLLEF